MAILRFNLMHSAEHVTLGNINKKRIKVGNLLIFACFFMYMMSMAVKGIYAAEISYIQEMWNIGYAQTSLANTFYFVTYGASQVVLFFIMRKISLKKYIAFTVPFSALCAILMGTSSSVVEIWAYFGLTGALQAGIYCGCNSILTRYLATSQLSKANKTMNLGYAIGTVLAYGTCALCITYDKWRLPYFILGGIFMVSVIIFLSVAFHAYRFKHINEMIDSHNKNTSITIDNDDNPIIMLNTKRKTVWFYVIDLMLAFVITSLYYFIMNNFTPLLVKEHGLSDNIAIYVSILAPVTIALGPIMVISLCNKHRNFIRQGLIFTLIALPIPLLLAFLYKVHFLIAIVLTVVFVVVTNGIKAVSLSVITFKMRKQINAGAYSALSNAVASLAAGITPTILGGVIDATGWQVAYLVVFGIMVVFTSVMLIIDVAVTRNDKRIKN
ncbi:MAG: MFS transporter [Clostridia bacterium]|nr:MFS transporter [Clostridia bacterium]